MSKPMTLRRVKNIVRRIDPELADDGFDIATLMVAALFVGPNQRRLYAFTGLPKDLIADVAGRLRTNGIWVGGKIHCSWADDGATTTDFILDLLVGQGLLAKTEVPR